MKRSILAAALMLAMPAQGIAAGNCLTKAEASDLMMYLIPDLVAGVAQRCAASLPDTAFLKTGGTAFVERVRGETEGRWPGARAAFSKFGDDGIPPSVTDQTLRALVREIIPGVVLGKINPGDCAMFDEMIGAVAPLPAANLDLLITNLMVLGSMSQKDEGSGFNICKSEK